MHTLYCLLTDRRGVYSSTRATCIPPAIMCVFQTTTIVCEDFTFPSHLSLLVTYCIGVGRFWSMGFPDGIKPLFSYFSDVIRYSDIDVIT